MTGASVHHPPRTYLDWNATAPLLAEARTAMLAASELPGNPSSVHAEGRHARAVVEKARDSVAALVGSRSADVVFTSGGTEANNTVLSAGWDTIVVSVIEHDSVLAPARAAAATGARVIEIGAETDGLVDPGRIIAVLTRGDGHLGRTLVSVQLANNETGVLQRITEIAGLVRQHGATVHTDAVQACGRMAIDMAGLGVDHLTLSAHKLGGPKGVGAMVSKPGAGLPATILGGGQERRRRSGTENIAGIAGFGAAAEVVRRELASAVELQRQQALLDRLEHAILRSTPQATIIGAASPRLVNTTCVAMPGRIAETTVIAFDLAGFAVSAGAACSSGKAGESHVLSGMGLAPEVARSAIRVSLGRTTTGADIEAFLDAWRRLAERPMTRAVA